jgi:carbonic anhydrase
VVLRVAGGNAQYLLPHVLSIDSLLHFNEAIVLQHTGKKNEGHAAASDTDFDTDCGATMFRDEVIRQELRKRVPESATEIDSLTFGEITV